MRLHAALLRRPRGRTCSRHARRPVSGGVGPNPDPTLGRSASERRARLHVQVAQLGKVGARDLVGVREDDLAQREREQHVQEQDLVRPDDALLLRLRRARCARSSSSFCPTLPYTLTVS